MGREMGASVSWRALRMWPRRSDVVVLAVAHRVFVEQGWPTFPNVAPAGAVKWLQQSEVEPRVRAGTPRPWADDDLHC